MNQARVVLSCVGVLMFGSVGAETPAQELTAITLFACDDQGQVDPSIRFNTGPVDAAYDLFVREVAEPSSATIVWLNDSADHTIRIPLKEGSHTYALHCDSERAWPRLGMNLFLDGNNGVPAVSVMAPMSQTDPPYPPFTANRAARTMGWPITDVPSSGSLAAGGYERGIWEFTSSHGTSRMKVTLVDFHGAIPTGDAMIDLVGPHALGASGKPDVVVFFTLRVEPAVDRPSDLWAWLQTVGGVTVGASDRRDVWKEGRDDRAIPQPFSFVIGDVPSAEFLKECRRTIERGDCDNGRAEHTVEYFDPRTGMLVRWDAVEYPEYRTVEWVVTIRNDGTEATPIVRDVRGLDCEFTRRPATRQFDLHYTRGDTCEANSFEPLVRPLRSGDECVLAPDGGRPTNGAFPYFNLRAGSEGVIVVVGWPGQWETRFIGTDETTVRVSAGQQTTRMRLEPGESIRTPRIVLQFAPEGDWVDSQNAWRRWMVEHNLPRPGGKPITAPMFNACSSHQFAEMTKANEQNQKEFIDSYLRKGLKIDYWWMDAGWYVGAAEKGWPWVGTWEVDRRPDRFPNGLRAVSDHGRAKGVKSIVWFEPERVAGGTWIATEHPEWVLGGGDGGLLNLGDPAAWDWLVNHIDSIITREGIDLYRQDFNIDPLDYWRRNDTEDRQGMTENRYVVGYLAYWDELLRRHPGMLIDSCASGGRRNDLETMRRAVPLLRSDYLFEPIGQQGHTYGLSFWLPFFGTGYTPSNTVGWGWGTGGISYDAYTRRSNMCPANTACFDFRAEVDDALIRKLYGEWLEVGPAFLGDYYPLTAHSLEPADWIAWQFHLRDSGRGMVQAFRRAESTFFGCEFRLRGLDADATYEVTNLDDASPVRMSGRQLMEGGLRIAIPGRPGAAVVAYRIVGDRAP
ncbi:MAG: alpha-galactosidase [Planctomycetes bacterium]|nr:alpha-galactosidase [Planctomycetota bacterium]